MSLRMQGLALVQGHEEAGSGGGVLGRLWAWAAGGGGGGSGGGGDTVLASFPAGLAVTAASAAEDPLLGPQFRVHLENGAARGLIETSGTSHPPLTAKPPAGWCRDACSKRPLWLQHCITCPHGPETALRLRECMLDRVSLVQGSWTSGPVSCCTF